MGLCKRCLFYSENIDNLNRDFNDVGNENEHFCPMYTDAIPDGIYDGNKDCQYYTKKEEQQ
jgi:hypothetical protein